MPDNQCQCGGCSSCKRIPDLPEMPHLPCTTNATVRPDGSDPGSAAKYCWPCSINSVGERRGRPSPAG